MTLEQIKDIISTDLSNHDKLNAIEDILMEIKQGPCGKTVCTSAVACDWCPENPELQSLSTTPNTPKGDKESAGPNRGRRSAESPGTDVRGSTSTMIKEKKNEMP